MTTIIHPTRRLFVAGLASLIAAPAIVRAASLMPVRSLPVLPVCTDWIDWTRIRFEVTEFTAENLTWMMLS